MLAKRLAADGIAYSWFPLLGGRRRSHVSSRNVGWRHPAFRAYADHVATDELAEGLSELLMLANGLRTAAMCAEILWWRCHRRLIADVLVSIGLTVAHIHSQSIADLHRLRPPARLARGHLSYTTEPGVAE